jgi:hypothetical protein
MEGPVSQPAGGSNTKFDGVTPEVELAVETCQ